MFDPSGGGISLQQPSADVTAQSWVFTGGNIVFNGTNDLIVMLGGLTQSVCIAINNAVGAPLTAGVPVEEGGNLVTTAYAGSFSGTTTLDNMAGSPTGCFNATQIDGAAAGDSYYFYHVLIER